MNKVNSNILDKILSFLSQLYPFYYKGKILWLVAGLLFFMTLFFEYVFEPFEVYIPEHKMDHFWISCIHASTNVILIGILSRFKITKKTEENWNIRKEILLIALYLLLVGIIQFLIRDIVYNNPGNWSWRYLFEERRNAFLIGTLFFIILISLNFNRLKTSNSKNAGTFNLSQNIFKPNINSIVFIKTQLKSDEFNLDINNFLFAKAAGNYVELCLKDETIINVLKRITLKELESILKPYPNIIKTHRSYLVNLHFINKVVGNAQGYKLQLKNYDGNIPVSRNMIENFNSKMNNI